MVSFAIKRNSVSIISELLGLLERLFSINAFGGLVELLCEITKVVFYQKGIIVEVRLVKYS
jgi:hypothetical protein